MKLSSGYLEIVEKKEVSVKKKKAQLTLWLSCRKHGAIVVRLVAKVGTERGFKISGSVLIILSDCYCHTLLRLHGWF